MFTPPVSDEPPQPAAETLQVPVAGLNAMFMLHQKSNALLPVPGCLCLHALCMKIICT